MTNTNYGIIDKDDGIFYTYKYDNIGSYVPVDLFSIANNVNDTNVSVNAISISINNPNVTFIIYAPTLAQKNSGNYYLNANGSWALVSGGGGNSSFDTTVAYSFSNTITFTNVVISSNGSSFGYIDAGTF